MVARRISAMVAVTLQSFHKAVTKTSQTLFCASLGKLVQVTFGE